MAIGVLSTVLEEVRTAPSGVRQRAQYVVAGVIAGLGVIVVDVVTGTNAGEVLRLVSLLLALLGIATLATANVLHAAAREPGRAPAGGAARPLHRVHRAIPSLAVIAAMLLTAATTLLIPRLLEMPWVAVPALLVGVYAALAAREGLSAAAFLYGEAVSQTAAAEAARAETAEARLAGLRARLHPHFLFNALNTITSLIRTDAAAAERATEDLSAVLRTLLEYGDRATVPLSEELDLVESWLGVERARFRDRLNVEYAIDDAARSASVPPLSVQPLVENALLHGLSGRRAGGTVRVSAAVEPRGVRLTVSDDGAGLPPRRSEGTGLGNLRRRLALLYGAEATLVARRAEAGGTVVEVFVPRGSSP